MRRAGGALLPLLLAAGAVRAAEPPAAASAEAPAPAPAPVRLTLAGAVRRALASAERVGAARAGLEAAGAAVGEAWAGALPRVSADAGVLRSKNELTEADLGMAGMAALLGGAFPVPERYATTYTAGLTATQPLFQGGRVWNGLAAARRQRDAAGQDLRAARLATAAAAARSYWDAVLAREESAVRRATWALAEQHHRETALRQQAGTASRFDLLRAAVALKNQETAAVAAENNARLAAVRLLREVGLPQDSRLELATPLAEPAPEPAAAAGAPRAARELETAFRRRPDLQRARLASEAAGRRAAAARAGALPALNAVARWGGQSLDDDPLQDDNFEESGYLGLQLQWAIFDGLLTRARVLQARAEQRRLEWQARGLRRGAELEVRQALLNLESARRIIGGQKANVGQAEEALRLAEEARRAGTATELDVQDARSALEEARLNLARALHRHALARVDLEAATGELDIGEKQP